MRGLIAAVVAGLIAALYVAVIYAFFRYIWPNLPPWASLIGFILLAVFVIGSPIFWLARWDKHKS